MTPDRKAPRTMWFEEAPEPRARLAPAFEDLPLRYLSLPLRTRLALSRHFGRYQSVADLVRADGEIRHVRNLGVKSLEQLDERIRALMARAEADARGADHRVEVLRAVQAAAETIPLSELTPDGFATRPWYAADPAAREAVAVRFDAMPIADWGLSNRSRNALVVSRRYRTVGAVLRADSDIRACRGLGRVTLAELHERAVAVLAGSDPAWAWLDGRGDDHGAATS